MEIRFLVDTQLPPSLAEFFKRRGLNAIHIIEYQLLQFGNIKNLDLFHFLNCNFNVIINLFTENYKSLVSLSQHKIVTY